jgi:CheY-like chemotaxis protein
LVVADRDRIDELAAALSELHQVELVVSSGGDEALERFAAHRPSVVVVTASLQLGDAKSLIVALRGMVPRAEVAIVVIGDDLGPVRTALDALDLAPDRFVTRPLSPRGLRFAVTGGMDAVRIVRGGPELPRARSARSSPFGISSRAERAPVVPIPVVPTAGAPARPVPWTARLAAVIPPAPVAPGRSPAAVPAAPPAPPAVHEPSAAATRAELRARWDALADSILDSEPDGDGDGDGDGPSDALDRAEPERLPEASSPRESAYASPYEPDDEPTPLPPPMVIKPRRHSTELPVEPARPRWTPNSDNELVPARELTLIIRNGPRTPIMPELVPLPSASPTQGTSRSASAAVKSSPAEPPHQPVGQAPLQPPIELPLQPQGVPWDRPPVQVPIPVPVARAETQDGLVVAARTSSDELWSEPVQIAELVDREVKHEHDGSAAANRELGLSVDDIGDDLGLDALGDAADLRSVRSVGASAFGPPGGLRGSAAFGAPGPESRDFARELRTKMSMMAQRLFQTGNAAVADPTDHAPRHDHHTEIDLAELGDEPLSLPEIESDAGEPSETREAMTSPGSWNTQVRHRGLGDSGALIRGVSDAAMVLAKLFAQGTTGRVWFRRDEVETVVYVDRGRPVFASSNEPRDRMGELLLREGKITASQYERCQTLVAESGRRMGEILVDLGYLKRRELLPAVRRHVEDLVYSLFSWDRGSYRIALDPQPSTERIRLSRHPAALILEGIRRKLDRTSLERLVGPPLTVIEVPDRERLGGIVNLSELAAEERAALAGFDGQADLAQVARAAGVDIADVLPLAWGLCVLGLAAARRGDIDLPEDGAALVGDTDLAIDRERVRARWQLVSEADYFALLGVRRDATAFEIRRAYQSARRDFAADCFPVDLRRELARELDDIAHVLDEAFRVLRDDQLRQTYLANLIDD